MIIEKKKGLYNAMTVRVKLIADRRFNIKEELWMKVNTNRRISNHVRDKFRRESDRLGISKVKAELGSYHRQVTSEDRYSAEQSLIWEEYINNPDDSIAIREAKVRAMTDANTGNR